MTFDMVRLLVRLKRANRFTGSSNYFDTPIL
jgi:hypothetical protein